MDNELKERFISLWTKYFNGVPLPITFFYTDKDRIGQKVKPPKAGHRCVLADIFKVIKGKSLCFNEHSFGCFGGKKYLGYETGFMPDFEYFLSCGIPGRLEGERYKKTPQLVEEYMKNVPSLKAPSKNIVFKRWDMLEADDEPDVAIFFGQPDTISGLFTLANFDKKDLNSVIAPFGAGCATIVLYPYLERSSENPRAVMGMFDVSARPCIPSEMLSFAVPANRLFEMIKNMEESFLTTASWEKLKKRIRNDQKTFKK